MTRTTTLAILAMAALLAAPVLAQDPSTAVFSQLGADRGFYRFNPVQRPPGLDSTDGAAPYQILFTGANGDTSTLDVVFQGDGTVAPLKTLFGTPLVLDTPVGFNPVATPVGTYQATQGDALQILFNPAPQVSGWGTPEQTPEQTPAQDSGNRRLRM